MRGRVLNSLVLNAPAKSNGQKSVEWIQQWIYTLFFLFQGSMLGSASGFQLVFINSESMWLYIFIFNPHISLNSLCPLGQFTLPVRECTSFHFLHFLSKRNHIRDDLITHCTTVPLYRISWGKFNKLNWDFLWRDTQNFFSLSVLLKLWPNYLESLLIQFTGHLFLDPPSFDIYLWIK